MPAGNAAPAQVLRYQAGLDARDQGAQGAQMVAVEAVCRAQRQADTVQTDRISCADALQVVQRLTAGAEVVLLAQLSAEAAARGALVIPDRCASDDLQTCLLYTSRCV